MQRTPFARAFDEAWPSIAGNSHHYHYLNMQVMRERWPASSWTSQVALQRFNQIKGAAK